jgi:hypothetical protein
MKEIAEKIIAFLSDNQGRVEEVGYTKFIDTFEALLGYLEILKKDSSTRYKNIKRWSAVNDFCGFMSIFSSLMPIVFTFFNNQTLTVTFSVITVILTSFTTFFQPRKRLESIIKLRDFSNEVDLKVNVWKTQFYNKSYDISKKEKILEDFYSDLETILKLISDIDKQ